MRSFDNEFQRVHLQAILDTTSDPIWSVDKTLRLLSYNTSIAANHKKQMALGESIEKSFVFGETNDEYKRAFKGESFQVKKYVDRNGKKKIYLLSFDPLIQSR